MDARLREFLDATSLSTEECLFLVCSPYVDSVKLRILNSPARSIPMERLPKGYFRLLLWEQVCCRYLYDLGENGEKMRGDSVSRLLAEGVHGPSEVVAHAEFNWNSLPECLPSAPNQSFRIEPLSFALYRSDDRGKT